LAVQNLRHRAFDNLLDLLAIRHWSENHLLTRGAPPVVITRPNC
jgi:hypothetical protein